MEGIIVKVISNQFTVLSENKYFDCRACGKFRNLKQVPLAGDMVIFDEKNNYITKILPRKNELVRPPVSNIDNAIIVTSTSIPAFSSNLLDKQLCIIEFNNIKPIICFTKLDMLNNEEKIIIEDYINYYKRIGYEVYKNTEIEKIRLVFKDKVSVFTGQTGAGKSTLLNNIDNNLKLKTNEVSISLGRGKHTTRHIELLNIKEGLVADTPGFSSLDFYDMKKEDIRDNFIEFNEYRHKCKYADCMHDLEDDCYIKELVKSKTIMKSRYDNYINFIRKVR